jgi:hypothetical protein
MKDVEDGQHRPDVSKRGYTKYSQTGSGGTIYVNYSAPPAARWLIEHPHFGNKFFADHDDILKWTVECIREQFIKTHGKEANE